MIDLGFGNPDIPSPQIAVEKLAEAAREADEPSLLVEPRAPQPAASGLRALRKVFGVQLDPDATSSRTIGAKEGLSHLMWVLVEQGDSVVVPSPAYPIHLVAPRLAGATVLHARIENGDVLSGIEEALEAAEPAAARRDRVLPAQPYDRDRHARS